jgi:mannan polymerase II complex MNN11 subunit
VQWHPTILSKLALVPQRTIASYTRVELGESYQDGDFVVVFPGCPWGTPAACEAESRQYVERWKANFGVAS